MIVGRRGLDFALRGRVLCANHIGDRFIIASGDGRARIREMKAQGRAAGSGLPLLSPP